MARQIPYSNIFWPKEGEILGVMFIETVIPGVMKFNNDWRGALDMQRTNFDIHRSDSRTLKVVVRDPYMNVIDLTNCKGVLSIRQYETSESSIIVKDTSVVGQGDIDVENIGDIRFYLLPADTALLLSSQYFYSVVVVTAALNNYTVATGMVNVSNQGLVTQTWDSQGDIVPIPFGLTTNFDVVISGASPADLRTPFAFSDFTDISAYFVANTHNVPMAVEVISDTKIILTVDESVFSNPDYDLENAGQLPATITAKNIADGKTYLLARFTINILH